MAVLLLGANAISARAPRAVKTAHLRVVSQFEKQDGTGPHPRRLTPAGH